MPVSRTEDLAERLLVAFHDLSGGKLNESVPVGGPDTNEEGAADRANFGADVTERDVALRYLVDQGYVRAADGSGYTMTVSGVDRVREVKGLTKPESSEEGSRMSDKTQRRLLTVFSTVIALAVSQPLTNYIGEQIPERRGIRDDALEAALQGAVRAVSIFLASMAVRQLVGRR